MNINEIISYLKSRYSTDNRDQITFIKNFPSQRDVPSFEEISERLKAISKSMKENENMSLKNKALFGGWISVAKMAYKRDKLMKRKDLSQPFDDWMYRECGIEKQKIYNYNNLYELMSVAPKLLTVK